MKKGKKSILSGATLALAMAGLSGCHLNQSAFTDSSSASGTTDLVHCYGVNKCKGNNGCGGKHNSCHGQGSCKATGFVALPADSCEHVGGTIKDDWKGQIASADLVNCFGVNVCGGHNACNTATNSCNGKGSCKGQGFVKASAKACSDIGGKSGK